MNLLLLDLLRAAHDIQPALVVQPFDLVAPFFEREVQREVSHVAGPLEAMEDLQDALPPADLGLQEDGLPLERFADVGLRQSSRERNPDHLVVDDGFVDVFARAVLRKPHDLALGAGDDLDAGQGLLLVKFRYVLDFGKGGKKSVSHGETKLPGEEPELETKPLASLAKAEEETSLQLFLLQGQDFGQYPEKS